MIPEHDLGYFLTANSADGELLNAFRDSFFDRYFPNQRRSVAPPLPVQSSDVAADLAGWYWFNRLDRRSHQKVDSLVGGYVHVSANADSTFSIDGKDYVEIEPLVFRDSDDRGRVAFRTDGAGQVDYLFFEGNAYEKVPWFNSLPFHLGMLAAVIVIFLSACAAWPGEFLIRRWRRSEPPPQPRLARIAWFWACASCAVNLLAIFVIVLTMSRVAYPSVAVEFQAGLPRTLTVVIAVATLFAALSLAVPVFAVMAWIKGYWSVSARVYFSSLAMACLAYVWFASFWNLIDL